jgi:hypothetical protein
MRWCFCTAMAAVQSSPATPQPSDWASHAPTASGMFGYRQGTSLHEQTKPRPNGARFFSLTQAADLT